MHLEERGAVASPRGTAAERLEAARALALVLVLAALSHPSHAQGSQATKARAPGTVVLDASAFLDEIQKGHTISDADRLEVPWLFNNTALVMGSRSNYVIQTDVPEPGTYYLYVRSHGDEDSYFRVAVGDRVIEEDLGDEPLRFERAGVFRLERGPVDVRLMRIEGGPVLDVLVLTQDPDFTEEDLEPLQLHEDIVLLKEFEIPTADAVRFGDLTGDGRTDFLVLTPTYSAHAFDHDGNELWSYLSSAEGEKDEPPGVIWDLDRDGAAEAIHWRLIEGQEWLVVADGRTGEIKKKTLWPAEPLPHPFYNYRTAIAQLRPGYPNSILAFTDTGEEISITAYGPELEQLWQRVEEKKKDHLGHYVYPVDLDEDGLDEVVASALVLDAKGNEIWNRFDLFYDHHDHADSYRFVDLNRDGQRDLVSSHSEVGVVVYDGRTGALIWQNMAEHTQQIEVGDFLDGVPGPQIAAGARTYGNRRAGEIYLWSQVWWFDRMGNLISKWPGKPLNGNPEFVKGDWRGDGKEELFWYKFRMNEKGKGELYFEDPVYHMFDFMGDGAEEVITLADGRLKVYGYRGGDPQGERAAHSLEYLRNRVANHTDY